jgi:hypothetical protein
MRTLATLVTVLSVLVATGALAQDAPAPAPETMPALAPAAEPAPAADSTCPCARIEEIRKAMDEGIATIRAGDFDITFHGRLNAWAGWVGSDALISNGDKMDKYGFRLRRARFGVEGHIIQPITYKIEMDLFDQDKSGGPLYEAWVDWTPIQYIGAKLGFMEFPLLRGMDAGSLRMAHVDRAIGTYAMSPTNSLGLVLHSEPWKDHLTISAGIFNGLERSQSFFTGYNQVGITQGNKFERLSYFGRVDFEPLDPLGKGEADLGQERSFRLGLGGGVMYNDGTSVGTLAWSAYLHMKAWGFHLLGEVAMDYSKPREEAGQDQQAAATDRTAVNGSVGYVFLKNLLGVAARVEYLDSNTALDDESDQMVYAGTLTYYAIGHWVKAQIEYQHRQQLHGVAIDDDSVILGVQAAF